ncbi:MAG: 50S ribosomal protein L9 [Halanaerobiales bacterium]|nr:50S ribosomal protein L9 [Halanaerobiales bacterium]
MKVILLKNVKNVGKEGQVLNVTDGYGRNYLIPRGLAKEATEGSLADLKHIQKITEKKKEKELKEAQKLKKQLEETVLEIKVKAGSGGRLFGSVTNSDIAGVLKKKGYKVDKRKIQLKENIKELGEHTVIIKLHSDVIASIEVKVMEI